MSVQKITTADVRHVALLSRLKLSDQEIDDYARVLNDILEYFAKLNQMDTTDVPPTSHSIPMKNVFRQDVNTSCLSAEEALSNAPEAEGNCFKVPKIIQEM